MMRPDHANRQGHVVLVNGNDEQIGTMEKLEAHRKGVLHRAFSIFLFDGQGRTLLQKRAADKYHSPGLWSNACCSHPFPDEDLATATARRLREELGIACPLSRRFSFLYKASFANDLYEHEYDHVFFGNCNGGFDPDPTEVQELRWILPEELDVELIAERGLFTPWLFICWPEVRKQLLIQPFVL